MKPCKENTRFNPLSGSSRCHCGCSAVVLKFQPPIASGARIAAANNKPSSGISACAARAAVAPRVCTILSLPTDCAALSLRPLRINPSMCWPSTAPKLYRPKPPAKVTAAALKSLERGTWPRWRASSIRFCVGLSV